jgi:hypothetical protein
MDRHMRESLDRWLTTPPEENQPDDSLISMVESLDPDQAMRLLMFVAMDDPDAVERAILAYNETHDEQI